MDFSLIRAVNLLPSLVNLYELKLALHGNPIAERNDHAGFHCLKPKGYIQGSKMTTSLIRWNLKSSAIAK